MAVASVGLGVARTAGIAWFLPESHVEVMRPPVAASPEPPKARPHSGAAPTPSRRRRRHHHRRSAAKDNDGVNVIDIEDEDHSFTSFFVGVGKSKSAGTNSSSSSEASEVKRPMVLHHWALGSNGDRLRRVERPPASLLFV